jgi:hypothetical protein
LHRFGETSATTMPSQIAREQWAVRVRDRVRGHLRARGLRVPDEDGLFSLLGHPGLASLRAALGVAEAPPGAAPGSPDIGTDPGRPITIANLRAFLESPVQAWAQAVLDLDELPDDEVAEHSDEPFHLDRPARTVLLRDVLAAQLMDPARDAAEHYDAVVKELALRGQFPVGVFGDATRTVDLRVLARWRAALGPIAVGAATRLAFGRSHSPNAELLPALELALPGGRSIRIVGQTELLVRGGDRMTSVVPLLGEATLKSRYHLRGGLDHVVLAAAGLAPRGHEHVLLDGAGGVRRVAHDRWTVEDARGYLAELAADLLDRAHGYLLPFDALARALAGGKGSRTFGDPTGGLGYGPIERADGLGPAVDAADIAQRRLGPLVARMRGEHGFGGDT